MTRGGLKIIEIKPTSTEKIPLLSPFTKGEEFMCLHLPLFPKEGSGEILLALPDIVFCGSQDTTVR